MLRSLQLTNRDGSLTVPRSPLFWREYSLPHVKMGGKGCKPKLSLAQSVDVSQPLLVRPRRAFPYRRTHVISRHEVMGSKPDSGFQPRTMT